MFVDIRKKTARRITISVPHTCRCRHCWSTFDASAPGARWKNAKGNPRYIHPNCPKGAKPGKGWTQEDKSNG